MKILKNVTVFNIPIQTRLPADKKECRRRVINLYKAWHRQLPSLLFDYKLDVPIEDARSKLRETFVKHSNMDNVAEIHNLVLRGQNELNELLSVHKEPCHFYKYFRTVDQPRADDFLTKFLQSNN